MSAADKVRIEAAGFVIANGYSIYGVGETADAAWGNFGVLMRRIRTALRASGSDADWTSERHFKALPASAALIAEVVKYDGAAIWGVRHGVACAHDEGAVS